MLWNFKEGFTEVIFEESIGFGKELEEKRIWSYVVKRNLYAVSEEVTNTLIIARMAQFCCCNKHPKSQWLNRTTIYFLLLLHVWHEPQEALTWTQDDRSPSCHSRKKEVWQPRICFLNSHLEMTQVASAHLLWKASCTPRPVLKVEEAETEISLVVNCPLS